MWIAKDKIGISIKVFKNKPIFKGYYFDSPKQLILK